MKYKLSDIAGLRNQRIEINSLSRDTYISTENMLPNRGGIVAATSLPSMQYTQAYCIGDVLVSNIRLYFKKIWQANFEGGCSNDVLVFHAKRGVDARWLYYVLADDRFFEYASATSRGTKMPRGDKIAIMNYTVEEHSYEEQRKISSVLSAIDKKIATNKAINDNLQQQAFAIFKHDFIDSTYPIECELRLGQICKCVLGGTPDRSNPQLWGGKIPWINSGEINRFRITSPTEFITELGLNSSATKMLPAKTTVVAITGATLGQYSLLEIPTCANQSVVGIIQNDILPYEFIYPFIAFNIYELISHQTGGAQQHINKQNIESLAIRLPKAESIKAYRNTVKALYKRIAVNAFASERLSDLRDTLLPKLMSGDIDVSQVEL